MTVLLVAGSPSGRSRSAGLLDAAAHRLAQQGHACERLQVIRSRGLGSEQQKDQVKLTVTHDEFAEDSRVFANISKGWPLVLSSLKSYLEANRVLYAPWYDEKDRAAAS